MAQLANTILRKGRFRVDGRHLVSAGHAGLPAGPDHTLADELEAELRLGGRPGPSQGGKPNQSSAPEVGPPMPAKARIVEQAAGVAVIEVTCSCGQVIHLQCFVGQPAAQPKAAPAPGPDGPGLKAGLANPAKPNPAPAAADPQEKNP